MKRVLPTLILIIGLLMINQELIRAQSGPAGVGDASSNKIWLDASFLTGLSNNASIGIWTDRSGNDWHAVQNNMNNQPTYRTNQLNGKSVVHFDRTAAPQLLQISNPNVGDVMSNSNTLYTVSKANTAGAGPNDQGLYQLVFATGSGYISGIYYTGYPTLSKNVAVQWVGGNGESPNTYLSSSASALINTWYISTHRVQETSGTNLRGYLNGVLQGNRTSSLPLANYSSHDVVTLGAYSPSGYMAALNGDIAEVIFFNTTLNDAQRIIVDNYLSAKYNLPISNDYYVGNDASYVENVQGIGTTNNTSAQEHTHAANGGGLLLTELNNSLNATNEFLFSGHNAAINSWVSTDLSAGNLSRWARIWYVRKTGGVDAKLSFDINQAGLVAEGDLANSLSSYKLLYRPTTSGPFSIVQFTGGDITPTLENADQLVFAVANAQLQHGYYTIGHISSLTWTGALNNQWNEAGNWSLNRIPTSSDRVFIGACITCPILNNSTIVGGLFMHNDSQLDVLGNTLTVTGMAQFIEAKIMSGEGVVKASDFAEIRNSEFTGSVTLEKTGGNENSCYGGNVFSSELKIINSGSHSWQVAIQSQNVIKTF